MLGSVVLGRSRAKARHAPSGRWLYRLGLTKAEEYALTGKPLSGVEAAEVELIDRAVPFERLEDEVAQAAAELASILASQLGGELAEREGVSAAVAARDALFADYSQAPPEEKPNPDNVIEP